MARANDGAYFKRSSLFWMLTITLSLGFYTWTVFWPDQVPYASMGPLGSFFQYLVKQHFTVMYYGWWLVWMIHISEAFYSQKLCSYCRPGQQRRCPGCCRHGPISRFAHATAYALARPPRPGQHRTPGCPDYRLQEPCSAPQQAG
uniref:Transmembrane protein 254 n=1 Tax=Paramormyrops kingsleyae TaxID=1676925 RepID=A0A3B3S493_9TELE